MENLELKKDFKGKKLNPKNLKTVMGGGLVKCNSLSLDQIKDLLANNGLRGVISIPNLLQGVLGPSIQVLSEVGLCDWD